MRLRFLLSATDGSEEWGGRLFGHCYDCSKEKYPAKNAFKKEVNRRWQARKERFGVLNKRLRTINFHNLEAYFKKMFPGAPGRVHHDLTIKRIRVHINNIVNDYVEEQMEMDVPEKAAFQEGVKQIRQEYFDGLAAAAANPTWCSSVDGKLLCKSEINHLTFISTNALLPFLCRLETCLFVGYNDMWLRASHHDWYRCPLCKTHYRPGVSKGTWVNAQKVLISTSMGGELEITPCTWPNSHEDKVIGRMQELHYMGATQQLKANLNQTTMKLDGLLDPYKLRKPEYAAFRHYAWTEQGMDAVDETKWPRANYEKIIKEGFWGMQLSPRDCEKPFSKWSEFVAVLTQHFLAVAEMGK